MFQPVRPVICFVNFCFSFTVKAKNLGKPVFILKQSVGRKIKAESLIQILFSLSFGGKNISGKL